MLKKSVAAVALAGLLTVASFVGGAFGSPKGPAASPCACCEVCLCDNCVCDESGCACDNGGDCACTNACHSACCKK